MFRSHHCIVHWKYKSHKLFYDYMIHTCNTTKLKCGVGNIGSQGVLCQFVREASGHCDYKEMFVEMQCTSAELAGLLEVVTVLVI